MNAARVRAVAVDPTDRRGGWVPSVDARMAALEGPVRELLESDLEALSKPDRITLVPDAHYPFHPSSGMVTDPAVIGALIAHLERRSDADIAVVGASDDRMAFDRTAEYLGYNDVLGRFDADIVDLADESRTEHVRTVDGSSITLSVPSRLAESTTVVVPTLRPAEDGTVAGAMRTIASLVGGTEDPDRIPAAATRIVEPEISILDATTVYGGDPVATYALIAGAVPAVDTVATSLLGRSPRDDTSLATVRGGEPEPVTVEGRDVDFDRLRELVSDGDLPPSDETHSAVSTAYRIYATVAGDAVPPQLEGGR